MHNPNAGLYALNLVGSCLLVIGCTFPIKNDRIDTAVEEEDFSDFGQVEVLEIDNCDVDQAQDLHRVSDRR